MRRLALTALLAFMAFTGAGGARGAADTVSITGGPDRETTSTSATFSFVGTGAVTHFKCLLDNARSPSDCSSPTTYADLAVGGHTFTVSGYRGSVPVGISDSRTWTIVPPLPPPPPPPPPPPVAPVPPPPLPPPPSPLQPGPPPVVPDFALELVEGAWLPLTVVPGATSKLPVQVRVKRLGGSHGPVLFLSQLTFPKTSGLQVSVVADDPQNPTLLTVRLHATPAAKPAIGKSFTLTGLPGSALVGPGPRSIKIPYAVVQDYDLAVAGIDVTQGIQPEQALPKGPGAIYAGVPLVQHKRTVARVFVYAEASPGVKVGGVTVLLRGYRTNPSKILGPLTATNLTVLGGGATQVPVQTLQAGTPVHVFTLPASWTDKGRLTLRAEVVPPLLLFPGTGAECGSAACAANNRYKLIGVEFHDTGYVDVWPIWGKLRGGVFPGLPNDQPFPGNPGDLLAPVQQLLPLADGELRAPGWASTWDATDSLKQGMGWVGLLCKKDCNISEWAMPQGPHRDLEMVFVDDTPIPSPFGVFGLSDHPIMVFPFKVAAHAAVNINRPLTSVAHETGHALGRHHASGCDGGGANGQKANSWPDAFGYVDGIGYDVVAKKVVYDGNSPNGGHDGSKPGSWFDFMSYCARESDGWISLRNWKAYFEFLTNTHALRSNNVLSALQAPAGATLAIRGHVEGGRVVVTRIGPGGGPESTRQESAFRVLLRDRSGAVLADWPLKATSSEGHGGEVTFLSADVPLGPLRAGTLPESLAAVEVVSGGRVTARVERSTNAPAVRILAPRAGTRVRSAGMTVRWTATDADPGAALVVAIDYSTDDGRTWRTVHSGPNTGRAALPGSLLAASKRARLRVRVSDGFDETWAVSGRIVAAGRRPHVTIASPSRGSRFPSDEQIYLSATAYDDAGTFLDGARIVWLDGSRRIATGRLASASGLTPGLHVLRAVARDRLGRTGSASVRVRILPATPAIIVSGGPNRLSPRARRLALRLSCTVPSVLTAAGPGTGKPAVRHACGPRLRTVHVPIEPGRGALHLQLRAQAGGRSSTLRLKIAR